MVTTTKSSRVKRLDEKQLTNYFLKDCELALSNNQLHLNDEGKMIKIPDKDYVDDTIEANTNTIMSTVPSVINAMISVALSEAITNAKADFLSSAYPLGAIYMSVSDIDPSFLFGGTWAYWGSGRMPVSYNPADPNFAYVEQIGGGKTVALSVNNLPTIPVLDTVGGDFSSYLRSDALTVGTIGSRYGWDIHNGSQISPATKNIGVSENINILNPYITCYMWKRVQ